jgi:hypothetical protein
MGMVWARRERRVASMAASLRAGTMTVIGVAPLGWGDDRACSGVEEVGDAGKVAGCGEGALGPDEGNEPGEDDGEDVEGVHSAWWCRFSFAEKGRKNLPLIA